ncbi:MAG: anti-sigma factor family protein [Planctomycetota bacterium]
MSCRSYQEELSRCLDGRLQSHARARVMDHAARCSHCARFWEELKGAQELALGLPQAKVGPHFRDDVWQRIQAGEGAPDSIAQEPVPALTKVRYGVLGAAAAAVFILAVHYGVGNSPVIQESPEVDPVATNTTDATKPAVPPRMMPRMTTPPAIMTPAVSELTPANLAAKTAERVSVAARRLRDRSKNLTNPDDFPPEVIRDVRREIETMQSGLVMLKQLRERFGIELRDREARDCETRVLTTLEINSELKRPEQVMRTLTALSGCSLERLHEKLLFSLRNNRADPPFMLWLQQQQMRNEFLRRQMQVMSRGQPGEMRVDFWMIEVMPQPAGPEKQPEKTDRPKLRERSRR